MDKYSIISGGDVRWLDESPASVIINGDFFGVSEAQTLEAGLHTDSDASFTQTIQPGAVTLTATNHIDSDTTYSQTVSLAPLPASWTGRYGVSMTTNVGGFWEFKPAGWNTEQKACIIAFHGTGEQGDGNLELDELLTQGLSKLINDRMGGANEFPYDCYVICPQYTGGTLTSGRTQNVINYVKANYNVDPARIHMTGLSLGAEVVTNWWFNGTLTDIASCTMLSTPSQFYQPGADNAVAADMPCMFLHGTADSNPFTPYTRSERWVNGYEPNGWEGLNGLGITPSAILVPMTGYDHNTWNDAYDWLQDWYNSAPILDWITAQSRDTTPTLTATTFSDSDTTYSQTITTGAVNLTATNYVDGDTNYSHSVSQSQTIAATNYTDADSYYSASVTVSGVTLSASLYVDSDGTFNQTVQPSAVSLTASLYTDGDVFYSPSFGIPPIELTATLHIDTDGTYSHSVTVGAVNILPAGYDDADTFYSHQLQVGAVSVEPELFIDGDTYYEQTIAGIGNTLFVYNNGWVRGSVKAWDGKQWTGTLKIYDGLDWINVN